MSERRTTNPGRRERVARKAQKPKRIWYADNTFAPMSYWKKYHPAIVPLELGRKHYGRWIKRSLTVADTEKSGVRRSVMSLSATRHNEGDLLEKND